MIHLQTQYYIVKSGDNTIYIGTYASAEPSVGELRFIARLSKSALPNGYPQSDIVGGTSVEGTDVYLVNGQTRSKFYSSVSLPLLRAMGGELIKLFVGAVHSGPSPRCYR